MLRTIFLILTLSIILVPLLTGCATAFITSAAVGVDIASDRRTAGMYIEDQSIELRAGDAIHNDKTLSESSSISVVSFNRVVLLVGQAPNSELKNRASDVVRNIGNVRKIHNEVRIAAPSSILSSTNDAWLTTKAKTQLLAEKDFSSGHIKVISENGEIFLMGMVTRAEADKAIAIVRDIDGAERIVQVFEYIH